LGIRELSKWRANVDLPTLPEKLRTAIFMKDLSDQVLEKTDLGLKNWSRSTRPATAGDLVRGTCFLSTIPGVAFGGNPGLGITTVLCPALGFE
jgi:hypothetical protein